MKDYDFLMVVSLSCILIGFFLVYAGTDAFYSGFHNVDLIMNRYVWSVNLNKSELMTYNETFGSGKELTPIKTYQLGLRQYKISSVLLLGSGLFFGMGVSILAMLTVKRKKMEEG